MDSELWPDRQLGYGYLLRSFRLPGLHPAWHGQRDDSFHHSGFSPKATRQHVGEAFIEQRACCFCCVFCCSLPVLIGLLCKVDC